MVVGTNPPARTTPIRLLVEAKASTAFLRRARVCSQPCQRGRAGQRASRQAAGQSRAQKEEVTSVSASHRYPIGPIGRGPLHGTASPSGSPRTQSQVIRKGGHLARQERQWEEWQREGGDPIRLAPLSGRSMGTAGETPGGEAHRDPASSVSGLPTSYISLPT